jgi:hypothetical protein
MFAGATVYVDDDVPARCARIYGLERGALNARGRIDAAA